MPPPESRAELDSAWLKRVEITENWLQYVKKNHQSRKAVSSASVGQLHGAPWKCELKKPLEISQFMATGEMTKRTIDSRKIF